MAEYEFRDDFFTEAEANQRQRAWHNSSPLEWGGFILRPEAPQYATRDKSPCCCGIYALWDRECMIYIGRSTNIAIRLQQHERRSPMRWDRFSFKHVPPYAVNAVEVAHIKALSPPENMYNEGAFFASFDAMRAAITECWKDWLPDEN